MVNDDIVAVAVRVVVPSGGGNGAVRCRVDGSAIGGGNVGAVMTAAHPSADLPVFRYGPQKAVSLILHQHAVLQPGAAQDLFVHRGLNQLDVHRDGLHRTSIQIDGVLCNLLLTGTAFPKTLCFAVGKLRRVQIFGGKGDGLPKTAAHHGLHLKQRRIRENILPAGKGVRQKYAIYQPEVMHKFRSCARRRGGQCGLFQKGHSHPQMLPLAADRPENPIHIDGGALAQGISTGTQNGVCHLAFGHGGAALHQREGGPHLQMEIRAGDAALYILPRGIKDLLGCYTAHILPIYLNGQQKWLRQRAAHQQHKSQRRQPRQEQRPKTQMPELQTQPQWRTQQRPGQHTGRIPQKPPQPQSGVFHKKAGLVTDFSQKPDRHTGIILSASVRTPSMRSSRCK